MVRRGSSAEAKSPEYFQSLCHLICTTLSVGQIRKEKVTRSIPFIVLFIAFCNVVISLTALYIGLFVRKLEFSVFRFLYGICKRLVSITSSHLFFSCLLGSCCGEDVCLTLQIVTSTLLLFPLALLVHSFEVLEPRTVIVFYALFSMRLIIKSLEGNSRGCEVYRRVTFRVCVIFLQYAVFCSIRSTLFIYF